MPAMSLLRLEPQEVLYFDKSSSSNNTLRLTNLSAGNVAFKIKTTAPKSYLVKPCTGTLMPQQTQDVTILLHPHGCDGSNAHRFLVQAVAVRNSEHVSREEWGRFPTEAVNEVKLDVIFHDCRLDAPSQNQHTRQADQHTREAETMPQIGGAADLKVKYDELVAYTLALERKTKGLQAELNIALDEKKVQRAEQGGWKASQVFIVAVLAIAALIKMFSNWDRAAALPPR